MKRLPFLPILFLAGSIGLGSCEKLIGPKEKPSQMEFLLDDTSHSITDSENVDEQWFLGSAGPNRHIYGGSLEMNDGPLMSVSLNTESFPDHTLWTYQAGEPKDFSISFTFHPTSAGGSYFFKSAKHGSGTFEITNYGSPGTYMEGTFEVDSLLFYPNKNATPIQTAHKATKGKFRILRDY